MLAKYQQQQLVEQGQLGHAIRVEGRGSTKSLLLRQWSLREKEGKQLETTRKELSRWATLKHHNLLDVKDYFNENGFLNVVTDAVRATCLEKLIKERATKRKQFSEKQIWRVFLQITSLLDFIHKQGLAHGNINPKSIFITKLNIVKVADFLPTSLTPRNESDCVFYCMHYNAPEVLSGQPATPKSDIWSLGCVLYELMTLRRAFDAESMTSIRDKIVRGAYQPLIGRYGGNLTRTLYELLQTEPRDRITAREILRKRFLSQWVQADLIDLPSPSDDNAKNRNWRTSDRLSIGYHGNDVTSDQEDQSSSTPASREERLMVLALGAKRTAAFLWQREEACWREVTSSLETVSDERQPFHVDQHVAICQGRNGVVYLFDTWDRSKVYFSEQPEQGQWRQVANDLNLSWRYDVQPARDDDTIYLIGGGSLARSAVATVEQFFPSTSQLRRLPELPEPVKQPAVIVHDRYMFVIGGRTNPSSSLKSRSLQIYNFDLDRWWVMRDFLPKGDYGFVTIHRQGQGEGGEQRHGDGDDDAIDEYYLITNGILRFNPRTLVLTTVGDGRLEEDYSFSSGCTWNDQLVVTSDSHVVLINPRTGKVTQFAPLPLADCIGRHLCFVTRSDAEPMTPPDQ